MPNCNSWLVLVDDNAVLPPSARAALRALHDAWRSHADNGAVPAPGQMRIDELFAGSPGAVQIAVGEGGDARYRFVRVGAAFNAALGRDITGYALSDVVPRNLVATVNAAYDRIVANRLPHYWVRTLVTADSMHHTYERLLVPLATDRGRIDTLLGVWEWVEQADTASRGERMPVAFSI